MLKRKLIPKHQLGGPVARLSQQKSSGSWGNRGQGNELQSALENGLENTVKFIGDISGLTNVYNSIFNKNPELEGQPEMINGQLVYELKEPETSMGAPILIPGLKVAPTEQIKEVFGRWQKAYDSLAATKSRLLKLGRAAELTNSKPYLTFQQINKELQKLVNKANKLSNSKEFKHLIKKQQDTGQLGKLTNSSKTTYKGYVASATDDLRHLNAGRPATKQAMNYVIDKARGWSNKSPAVVKALEKYDKKVAKGLNSDALTIAEQELVKTILDNSPGFFTQQRKVLGLIN